MSGVTIEADGHAIDIEYDGTYTKVEIRDEDGDDVAFLQLSDTERLALIDALIGAKP